METNDIKNLAEIMKNNDVTSLEIEDGKVKIKIERGTAVSYAALPVLEPEDKKQSSTQNDVSHYITSPMVGVFYSSPAPNEAPFVKEGSIVKKTDTVCIIEAMKLMNDIAAECDGKIAEILVKNGDVVEYGQKLFRVEVAK